MGSDDFKLEEYLIKREEETRKKQIKQLKNLNELYEKEKQKLLNLHELSKKLEKDLQMCLIKIELTEQYIQKLEDVLHV